MEEDIIKVRHISKQFKQIRAVDDLSFTVHKGDVYGFLGQNGAGKSTMIRMLLSLVKPTSGEIELLGKNLNTHRLEILKQIGAIIEKPDVYQYLSAYQNLQLFAKLSCINPKKKNLLHELAQVGLTGREHHKVKTFSQGMKQRLGIAIALIHDPEIIILDEPANGLDPQGIADMRKIILYLNKERKKTVVVSSHLISEIQQVASRILIINRGKKLLEGSAATLFDPAQTIVELATMDNETAFQKLTGSQWEQFLQPRRNEFLILKMHLHQVPDFNRWMVQQGIDVLSLQPRNSLEDLFIQVTTAQHVETL